MQSGESKKVISQKGVNNPMHNVSVDTVNKTANFVLHDQHELDLIQTGISELLRKQELATTQTSVNDPVDPDEIVILRRYQALPAALKLGEIRLTVNQLLDLEMAINEGIVKYEEEETDNPHDNTIVEMRCFQKLIHRVARTDLLGK